MAIRKYTPIEISCIVFRDTIEGMVKQRVGISWPVIATSISPGSPYILITTNDPTALASFPSMNISGSDMAEKLKLCLIQTCEDFNCKLKWGTVEDSVDVLCDDLDCKLTVE